MMGAALKFRHADVPRQATEVARLKVIQGPDTGAVFVINGSKVTIGRGEENDIVITDLKASRRHAEFSLLNRQWSVKDLGSANGIAVNGKSSRASLVKTGDTVTMGETTVEFVSAEAGTTMLKAVPRTMEQVEADQAAFRAQQNKVRQLAQFGGTKTMPAAARPASTKNARLPFLIGVAGIAVFVLFGNNQAKAPHPQARASQDRSLVSYLPQADVPLSKSAEVFFREGFREYREHNYLRARTEFETALQISPGNALTTLYLQNCNQSIDEEVKFELDSGKKSYESGDLKDAKIHYESVMRLLYRDQSNPSYIEARDQLTTVNKEMAGDQ